MRRLSSVLGFLVLIAGLCAPSRAYAQQSINIYVGGFAPASLDARSDNDDVIYNNLSTFGFRFRDFDGGTAGAEYLVALGDKFDAGLGVGIYSSTVRSHYRNLVDENNNEIIQRMKLRIVPFTATVRFLPLGHSDAINPYIGGGVGVFAWRYRETGDFVDTTTSDIFNATYTGSGTATGPVILGGVRVPFKGWDLGGEVRYQHALGDLPGDKGFSGSQIDLSGWNGLVTFNIHF